MFPGRRLGCGLLAVVGGMSSACVTGVAVIVRPADRITSASLKISAKAAERRTRRRIACR